jgi:predicted transcriptional regulator
MIDKTIKYISFIEAAEILNISESTFRRKVNKLPKSDLKKLVKRDKGRVFINANIVTIFNQIDYNEKIENILVEPEKIYKESQNEIEYLRRQNESLQNDNRNLVSMVIKLQNDIQGYIKQLGEGKKESVNIPDLILKIVLALSLVALVWYLVMG